MSACKGRQTEPVVQVAIEGAGFALSRKGGEMAEADCYTPPQAARILGLTRRRVTQMLNDRVLEGERLANGRWRISAAAVAQLLQRRSQEPSVPRRSSVGKAIEEIKEVKEQAAISERCLERLTDTLSRVFTRLESLEDRLDGVEQRLNCQSH